MPSRRHFLLLFAKLGALLPVTVFAAFNRRKSLAEVNDGQRLRLYNGCVLRQEDLAEIFPRRR